MCAIAAIVIHATPMSPALL